jgi:hypothetical protein
MNRSLHNTFTALFVAAVLMTGGLIVAKPASDADPVVAAQPQATQPMAAEPPSADQGLKRQAGAGAVVAIAALRAFAAERTALVRTREKDIEARADALARELQGKRQIGEILGQVAGFTAEVATEAALNAAMDETASAEGKADSSVAPPAPVRGQRHNRRSLAMPYFSFATQG